MNIKKALSFEERKFIEKCVKRWRPGAIPPTDDQPKNLSEISEALKRSKNAITYEVRRNGGQYVYDAAAAQKNADQRKSTRLMGFSEIPIDDEDAKKIISRFKKGESIYSISESSGKSYTKVMYVIIHYYFVRESKRMDDYIERLEKLEKAIKKLNK